MNRREFLKLSGAIGLAFGLPVPVFAMSGRVRYRVFVDNREIECKKFELNIENKPVMIKDPTDGTIYSHYLPPERSIMFSADGTEYEIRYAEISCNNGYYVDFRLWT